MARTIFSQNTHAIGRHDRVDIWPVIFTCILDQDRFIHTRTKYGNRSFGLIMMYCEFYRFISVQVLLNSSLVTVSTSIHT